MRKILLIIFAAAQVVFTQAQTLQSPEQFLGYKIGTRFTPHYKILNYFKAVETALPGMVKIEKYGET